MIWVCLLVVKIINYTFCTCHCDNSKIYEVRLLLWYERSMIHPELRNHQDAYPKAHSKYPDQTYRRQYRTFALNWIPKKHKISCAISTKFQLFHRSCGRTDWYAEWITGPHLTNKIIFCGFLLRFVKSF